MPTFRIFTESKADVKFLKDYILEVFGIELSNDDFDTLNSWAGYKVGGTLDDRIKQSYDDGKQIILVLDADNNYAARNTEVRNDFQTYNIPINLFLFPNDTTNGNLENLLTEIATERQLINCFLAYEECVRGYNLPLDKSRIYAYLDTLLPPADKIPRKNDLRVEENRKYRNPAHWNLHHEYLQPLHDFIAPLLNK